MEHHGFIHDILDVKILILFVMSRVEQPVSAQTIYELCLQDDCLTYFDVQESIPQMVDTGHLMQTADGLYTITDKGREAMEVTQDAVAFPVKHRAGVAVERFNRQSKREKFIRSQIIQRDNGEYVVHMGLDDPKGPLMDLQLTAPTLQQARRLEKAYRNTAETVYQSIMIGLMEEMEG